MPINELYHIWMRRIYELLPGERITQIRASVWLILGNYNSRSVCLSKVAGKILGAAKQLSITRRLGHLLDNPAFNVREWDKPVARRWLQAQWRCVREIRLIGIVQRLVWKP